MKGTGYWLGLAAGLLYILGCATLPEQPVPSAPYAVLEFPASIRLLALNDQAVDSRTALNKLRVNPGWHTLQLVHVAAGADGSRAHDGQHAAPFALEAQEGVTYRFMAKTWGIIWRPEVASSTPIPGYCQTHACTEVALQKPEKPQQATDCNWGNVCEEESMSEKADFRQFYREAHAVTNLSEREKIFMGLAVAMVRNCQPWVERRLADARKAGIADLDLDSAVDVIAAVDAGIIQSLNIRAKAQLKRAAGEARA